MENDIRKEVDDAVKISKLDKEIPICELTTDVYAHNLEKNVRNTTPFKPLIHSSLAPSIKK
jgi:hypothetical protein